MALFTIVAILWPVVLPESAKSEPLTFDPTLLTLQDAIKSALKKNPELAAANFRVGASAERITQAESGFYPQINISEGYQVTTNPMWAFGTKLNQEIIAQQDFDPERLNDPTAMDNFNTLLWMSWPIFDSGQTWFGRKKAKLSYQASVAGLDRSSQEIVFQTVNAYTDLFFAKKNVMVVDGALKTAREHLRVIENRYKTGLTIKSDLLRAQVHISELELQQVEINSQYLMAQARLGAVIGEERDCDPLPDTLPPEKKIPPRGLMEWIEVAMATRPDLQQIKFQEQAARTEIKRSRSAHLPSVNINASYEIDTEAFDNTANNYTVGTSVTLNLFSGNNISAREREALYLQKEINANLHAMNQRIGLETREAYYRINSAEKRIKTAELSVDEAMEVLRIVGNRYENGQVSIVSLLDAETTLTRVRNNLNMALKDQIQSRAQLALAVGDLGETF